MIHINLLKAEPAPPPIPTEEVVKEKKPVPITSLLGLFLVVIIAVGFLQFNAIRKERRLLDVVMEEKAKLKDVDMKLQQVKGQRAIILRKINLINELKSHQGIAVSIMDELSKHIPYWIWLTEVNYDRDTIQIRGRAMSNNLIADYIYALETSPYFNNVNLISSTQREARGNQYHEFSLTVRFTVQGEFLPSPQGGQIKVTK